MLAWRAMARTPAQRGAFGSWLKRKREARYSRQLDALADIKRLTGVSIAPSEFAQWEAGSRVPRPDNPKVQALYDFFGDPPTELSTSGGEAEGSALVAATLAQNELLRESNGLLREQNEVLRQALEGIRLAFVGQSDMFRQVLDSEPKQRKQWVADVVQALADSGVIASAPQSDPDTRADPEAPRQAAPNGQGGG